MLSNLYKLVKNLQARVAMCLGWRYKTLTRKLFAPAINHDVFVDGMVKWLLHVEEAGILAYVAGKIFKTFSFKTN